MPCAAYSQNIGGVGGQSIQAPLGGAIGAALSGGGANINLSPNTIRLNDPLPQAAQAVTDYSLNLVPLKPNEFQKYALEVTGLKLPLYGASFFDSIHSNLRNQQPGFSNTQPTNVFAPVETSPVSGDYPIGQGDQLIIRGWGSLEIDVRSVVDRNGNINIPKVGVISVGGVKFSQIEGLIKAAVNRNYKDFQLSVSMGQLRNITIYTVGQARRPGSYTLSSMSTLATAFFSTGGPSGIGSMRNILLRRNNKVIAEFDLYAFLLHGDSSGDIKLIDGDVIVIPEAIGHVALIGKINNQAIYELKNKSEGIKNLLSVAGGLSITADLRRAYIERLNPKDIPPRKLIDIDLSEAGKNTILLAGDIITIQPISMELANSVSLRGNVNQPSRFSWRQGLRIRDIIPSKEYLISKDSLRRQNEVLFDSNQRERTLRERELMSEDLLDDPALDSRVDQKALRESSARIKEIEKSTSSNIADPYSGAALKNNLVKNNAGKQSILDQEVRSVESFREARQARMFSSQAAVKINERSGAISITESIGNLYDEINWDYAVIERINRNNLEVVLMPFNLGNILNDEKHQENYLLEPGDVITVFSTNDIRVPVSKRRIYVRVEGEVGRPGIYQANADDTLEKIIRKAGGLTHDAYMFGAAFYREEVRKSQIENLDKLIRKLEYETSGHLAQASQSLGAASDANIVQARILSAQQARREAIERVRNLRPEGRIALGLEPQRYNFINKLPNIRLQNGDKLIIPTRPDFVYIYGAVNTESALIFKEGQSVKDYLEVAGVSTGADRESVILIRADGSALTAKSSWFGGSINSIKVMPGDSIVMPDKLDREASWSAIVRNAKDVTQIFYQLGLGAAGLKALGY